MRLDTYDNTPMLDVVVLFFLLGVFARWVKSDLRMPEALYETLSIYLLLAIGLKGGIELHRQEVLVVLPQVLVCMALGFAIPFLLVPVLKAMGLKAADRAALAAHYGSVSVVTFAVASQWLLRKGVPVEPHAALWVAVMEAPGIVAGVLLARWGMAKEASEAGASTAAPKWQVLVHDVLFGKSVLLLAGGIAIGAYMGEAGTASIQPLFGELFKAALALFLLEMGLVAGSRMASLKTHGLKLVCFAIAAPVVLAALGAALGAVMNLSLGGTTILAVLAASASYIAAPTAMRIAVPQANAGLSITAALGITFPFNLVVGIALYHQFAKVALSFL
jgi:uncharacterized protein